MNSRDFGPAVLLNVYVKSALRGKHDALVGAAIGDFGVQIGRSGLLNQPVPGSSPGAPTKFFKHITDFTV
jgi:hypothetical protein